MQPKYVLLFICAVIVSVVLFYILNHSDLLLSGAPFAVQMDYASTKDHYLSFDSSSYKGTFYMVNRCQAGEKRLYQIIDGIVFGQGSYRYYDEKGTKICTYYWSIGECKDDAADCQFTCPSVDSCDVLAYGGGLLNSLNDTKKVINYYSTQ